MQGYFDQLQKASAEGEADADAIKREIEEEGGVRGGFPILTSDNFLDFMRSQEPLWIAKSAARQIFLFNSGSPELLQRSMKSYERLSNFGVPFSDEEERKTLKRLRYKLPMFYTSFPLKRFCHGHNYVFYESEVSKGWIGRQENFLWRIPQDQRWWVIDGVDYGVLFDGIEVG